MSQDDCEKVYNCRFVVLVALSLHSHAPRRYKFIQQTIAVEFWTQGASEKVFHTLNYVGLCSSRGAARGLVDKLVTDHDADVCAVKTMIEVKYNNLEYLISINNFVLKSLKYNKINNNENKCAHNTIV